MGRFSQRCFQKHQLWDYSYHNQFEFFENYFCVNLILFFEDLKNKSPTLAIWISSCQYWVGRSGTTTAALVLPQIVFSNVWPIILNGWNQIHLGGNASSTPASTVVYNKNGYLIVYWHINKFKWYFTGFSQYFLNSSGFSC